MSYPARRRSKPKPPPPFLDRALWSDPDAGWLEAHIQAAIVIRLRQNKVAFEAGLEGVRLGKAQRNKAKVQGMDSGKCDIKVYLPGARTIHVELKRKGGRVSGDQLAWHDRLRALGFEVHVVYASCPQDGIDKMSELLGIDMT